MTIAEIKNKLSLALVLRHYGLTPNRNGMLCCPFHDDKKASMKIYAETNTAYCFAGSCEVESVDVIDFIMKMDSCSKHEAIKKAKQLCGQKIEVLKPSQEMNQFLDVQRAFVSYRKSLQTHKPSREYCESRKLDWRTLEIGYKSRKTSDRWGRGCIIFPLLDKEGKIVSLYGRGITGSSHYYQSNREGLYPSYPGLATKRLVLLESILDVATLQPVELPLGSYTLMSLYGTNGLTGEHLAAIGLLHELEEIVFCFDGDKAGDEATKAHLQTLSSLHPGIKMSHVELPRGEDVNSLAVAHESYEALFIELFKKRKVLKPIASRTKEALPELNTSDPYNVIYATTVATYYIKGGVRHSPKDLDSLKVTLVVEAAHRQGRPARIKKSRNKADLYEDRQLEKVARAVSERLGLRSDLVELDLHYLVDLLEGYQRKLYEGETKAESCKPSVGLDMKNACLKLLKDKNLMSRLDHLLKDYGLVGERNNRRLGFCIVSSYGMLQPLHGLIQGSSGSGKTHLLSLLSSLVPEESYIPITRATDNSFYNFGKYDLKNKLISIEDKDAMSEEANLAFRELQSKGMVSSSTTGQDENGNARSYIKVVCGPVASLACTTKGDLYLDDMNRCFLLAIDESEAQTKRVLDYQKRKAAGLINESAGIQIQRLIQNSLRLLKSERVVIGYAPRISLPADVKDKRRLNSLYLSLVKQITLLHQYQRKKDGEGRLIATKSDLRIANEILFDAIVLKVDELHGPLRSFYESLKRYIMSQAGDRGDKYEFIQREIRHHLYRGNSYVKQHLRSLLELEYIRISGGSDYRGYRYQLVYWDDSAALCARIKKYLEAQIEGLV